MRDRLDCSLYLVTDSAMAQVSNLVRLVEEAVRGGVTMVQLREKDISTERFIELARPVRDALRTRDVPLLINDDIEAALAVEAHGVHLGQSDTPWATARQQLGDDAIIGLSIETREQLVEAEQFDVDYFGVGPIFSTKTKATSHPEWGLERLSEARSLTSRPLVAIGGIDASNAADVIQAGASGVAVVSAICRAKDVCAAAKVLRVAIESARKRGC